MLGREREGAPQVGLRAGDILPGQGEHQVQVDIIEAGLAREFECAPGLPASTGKMRRM